MHVLLLLQEAAGNASKAPASPFDVNFGLFIYTWAIFLALFLVLRKYAWPAILQFTEDREKRIAQQLSEAEKNRAESARLLEEQKKLLAEARSAAQGVMAEAKGFAEKERTAALEKTRHEQEALLDRARREIVAEREKAVAELRREAVDISLAAASKLVGQRFDAEADRKLVSEYLGSLGGPH